MATAFAPLPSPAVRTPRLLKAVQPAPGDVAFHEALVAALNADRQVNRSSRPERRRIACLLCELGVRLTSTSGSEAKSAKLPLSREDLARMLGSTLVRVKRALGLLMLSGIIRSDGRSIEVVDWRKLCALAGYDIALIDPSAINEDAPADVQDEGEANRLTIVGEPACFV
jgi:hypothetical protein